MLGSLNEYVEKTGASINEQVSQPWPIEHQHVDSNPLSFDIEKVLKIVDQDRMDILSTLIRVTLVETEMDLVEGILALRAWEQLVRQQLCRCDWTRPTVLAHRVAGRVVTDRRFRTENAEMT